MRVHFWLIACLVLAACSPQVQDATNTSAQNTTPAQMGGLRPFLLGSSQWPPDMNQQAIEAMYKFKDEHTDLAVFHQVAGVPWTDMAAGKSVPRRVRAEWDDAKRRAEKKRVYLALTPLNDVRTDIADIADDRSDHEALPAEWSEIALNDLRVKEAYLAYVREAIAAFEPSYLAIGIESNILASHDDERFAQYVELNAYVYDAIKREHPNLPVFVTVQNEHLIGVITESKDKRRVQEDAVRTLMKHADILGVSVYPYGPWQVGVPNEKYFTTVFALANQTNRPIAIAETGYPSKTFVAFKVTFAGSPEWQAQYVTALLNIAQQHRFVFVVNWVTTDFDQLIEDLPPSAQELSQYWAYTGLQYSNGTIKPALVIWDAALARAYEK